MPGVVVDRGRHPLALTRSKLVHQLAPAEEAEHGHCADLQLVRDLALLLKPGAQQLGFSGRPCSALDGLLWCCDPEGLCRLSSLQYRARTSAHHAEPVRPVASAMQHQRPRQQQRRLTPNSSQVG